MIRFSRLTLLAIFQLLLCLFTLHAQSPELVVQRGHEYLTSVRISPDGKLIASGTIAEITIWEIETRRELRRIKGQFFGGVKVAISADSQLVANASFMHDLTLWEMATGKAAHLFESVRASAVGFSLDGKFIAAGCRIGDHEFLKLWNVATRQPLLEIPLDEKTKIRELDISPDSRLIATVSEDQTVRIYDAATLKVVQQFKDHEDTVHSLRFSLTGKLLATGSQDKTAAVRDTTSWQLVRRFNSPAPVTSVTFYSDEMLAIFDEIVRVQNVKTGEERAKSTRPNWHYKNPIPLIGKCQIDFRNEARLLACANMYNVMLVGPKAGLMGNVRTDPIRQVSVSSNGRDLAAHSGQIGTTIWNLQTGQPRRTLAKDIARSSNASFSQTMALSPDFEKLAITDKAENIRLLNAVTGKEISKLTGHSGGVTSLAFNPRGDLLVTGGSEAEEDDREETKTPEGEYKQAAQEGFGVLLGGKKKAAKGNSTATAKATTKATAKATAKPYSLKFWSVATGRMLRQIPAHEGRIQTLAFSPDGRKLASGEFGHNASVWDAITGRQLFTLETDTIVNAVTFSPDNRIVVTAVSPPVLWNALTGKKIRELADPKVVINAIKYSPDGKLIAGTSNNGSIFVWNATTGKLLRTLTGHTDAVDALSFSADSKYLVSGGEDCATNIWDAASGKLLASLFAPANGKWVVVTPDGRFDTGDLDNPGGLSWILPTDPLHALPLEIFMKSYYEPRLLPRLLAGEKLPEIRRIAELNIAQPQVNIVSVTPDSGQPDTVLVTVEVSNVSRQYVRDGGKAIYNSGVHDLRLFRDGQLVGYAPALSGFIRLDRNGRASVTLPVRLPKYNDLKEIEFTAYAFNADRIKSQTAVRSYTPKAPLKETKGRAYLISIGINAYQNSTYDLRFAANDAIQLQNILSERLKATGQFAEVIAVPLISDYELKDGNRNVTIQNATKLLIHSVLDVLAGKQPANTLPASLPNAARLERVRPEDLVILSFASHGYADASGEFYFVTSDSGAGTKREVTAETLKRSISSEELSLWLRDVDAGEMILIVDACQSAASVQGNDFKPGPMGSRGLGQLSYDKGMRILTATQADNVALETKAIRHGLMTYALLYDGIERGLADQQPLDQNISLDEWLQYAVERVPQLYQEVRQAGTRTLTGTGNAATNIVILPDTESRQLQHEAESESGKSGKVATVRLSKEQSQVQQPSLFDFARRKREILILKKAE